MIEKYMKNSLKMLFFVKLTIIAIDRPVGRYYNFYNTLIGFCGPSRSSPAVKQWKKVWFTLENPGAPGRFPRR